MKFLNNILSCFFIAFAIVSCNLTSNKLEFGNLLDLKQNKNCLLISCVKCSCITNELDRLYKKDSNTFRNYIIYGDTSCLKSTKFKHLVVQKSQSSIDSFSMNFYNVLIFNPKKFGKIPKMVLTEESHLLEKFMN
jgi:hypothetical protein